MALLTLTVNGREVSRDVAPETLLVEFLRERQEKEDANKVIRFERKVV